MKSPADTPKESHDTIKTSLTVPRQNYDKDIYIIDLESPEKTYCLGTESGLLDTLQFDGVYTDGDDSCDVASPPSLGENILQDSD